ncbi:hypothetical protein D3C81_1148480 [compost metagenome]
MVTFSPLEPVPAEELDSVGVVVFEDDSFLELLPPQAVRAVVITSNAEIPINRCFMRFMRFMLCLPFLFSTRYFVTAFIF